MSYRELRDFTEVMRALGYPRLISVENFRTPNFELVADVLYWMVKRYDPEISVHDGIETEDDRVEFLIGIAQNMASKASIKLNTKKLYSADGHAVKELLKVANTLYSASRADQYIEEEDEDENNSPTSIAKLSDVKGARSLASEITERGAKLHDLLKMEMEVRQSRMKSLRFLDAISGNLESGAEQQYIERALNEIIETTKDDVDKMKKQVSNLDADEKALAEKIKRKQTDLERNKKRLASLQHVRPAFMDEYEKLEKDLQKQYDVYLERFRNLDYLEHELDELNRVEKEKVEEADRTMKRMQKRLREDELKILRGEQDGILGMDETNGGGGGGRNKNTGIFGGGTSSKPARENAKAAGKMNGGDSDESDSDDLSDELTNEDSDSEDVSVGGSSGGSSGSSNIIENDDGSDGTSGSEGEDGGPYNGSGGDESDDYF